MSSFRNAVKRKTHKERSQPEARKKFGLLEKHKDYVLRARDYNSKKKRLKALQEKAAFRNPDEFYFKMEKMRTKGGVHTNVGGDTIDEDTLQLMRTQDFNYISMKRKTEDNKIEKMKAELHSLSALAAAPKQNSHTIFFDSDDEEMEDFEPSQHFNTVPEMVDRSINRPTKEQLDQEIHQEPAKKQRKKLDRAREAKYRELMQRVERKEKLDKAINGLQTQRNLMGKGKRTKIGGQDGKSAQYVWKQQRKR